MANSGSAIANQSAWRAQGVGAQRADFERLSLTQMV
jgi:hypothetical protein